MKKAEREQAIQLRQRGFTYAEIAKLTQVSVSTVSSWLAHEPWSQKMAHDNKIRASRENSKRISLLNTARGNQYKKLYAEAERSAVTEYRHYKRNPLFIAGLMLYAGEGDNSNNHLIRIANARPDTHCIFIKFATEYLGVSREKIRFWILLTPNHDPHTCSRKWSDELEIPFSQFHKYQVIQRKGATPQSKSGLHYGVGNTIIGSTVLKRKLMKWIELSQKELTV